MSKDKVITLAGPVNILPNVNAAMMLRQRALEGLTQAEKEAMDHHAMMELGAPGKPVVGFRVVSTERTIYPLAGSLLTEKQAHELAQADGMLVRTKPAPEDEREAYVDLEGWEGLLEAST